VIPTVAAACGTESDAPSATPVSPTNGSIAVSGFEWGFEPRALLLQQGEEVQIDFVNDGATLHDLKIDDLDAAGVTSEGSGLSADEGELFVAAEDGESGVLTFTPNESGEFGFYCTIPRHRSLGMEGTIVVAPASGSNP
jgi:plastocyanin